MTVGGTEGCTALPGRGAAGEAGARGASPGGLQLGGGGLRNLPSGASTAGDLSREAPTGGDLSLTPGSPVTPVICGVGMETQAPGRDGQRCPEAFPTLTPACSSRSPGGRRALPAEAPGCCPWLMAWVCCSPGLLGLVQGWAVDPGPRAAPGPAGPPWSYRVTPLLERVQPPLEPSLTAAHGLATCWDLTSCPCPALCLPSGSRTQGPSSGLAGVPHAGQSHLVSSQAARVIWLKVEVRQQDRKGRGGAQGLPGGRWSRRLWPQRNRISPRVPQQMGFVPHEGQSSAWAGPHVTRGCRPPWGPQPRAGRGCSRGCSRSADP